jgi:hypothetical protein
MTSALIGHTGFVGGNLAAQHRFDACFHSKTIDTIAGRHFDTLVVSGMPAAKWIANGNPAADRATLDHLWNNIRQVTAGTVVVISTVDVYPTPVNVDEATPIDPSTQQPYGLHRHELEQRAAANFPRVLCVRLPGLFGLGLKKNALFDLMHNHETHKIHANGVFQFYPLARLWCDIQQALAAGLRVVNLATEPLSIREVAREAFGLDFSNDPGTNPARYDVRSQYAASFGGQRGYLLSRDVVLGELREFVQGTRAAA